MEESERTQLLKAYIEVFNDDDIDIEDQNERAAEIATEMAQVRDAPDLEAACAVIEWWGWDDEVEFRESVSRLRAVLGVAGSIPRCRHCGREGP